MLEMLSAPGARASQKAAVLRVLQKEFQALHQAAGKDQRALDMVATQRLPRKRLLDANGKRLSDTPPEAAKRAAADGVG